MKQEYFEQSKCVSVEVGGKKGINIESIFCPICGRQMSVSSYEMGTYSQYLQKRSCHRLGNKIFINGDIIGKESANITLKCNECESELRVNVDYISTIGLYLD